MWRRRKRSRRLEVSPVTLCDLCAMVLQADEAVAGLDADRLLQSKPMRQFEDGAGAR